MIYDRFDVSLRHDRWAVSTQGTIDVTAAGAEIDMPANGDIFEIGDIDINPTPPAYGFAETGRHTTFCPTCKRRWP